MAFNAVKTLHNGAKHGQGAYWGPKAIAKHESSRISRRLAKEEAAKTLKELGK